MLSKNRQCQLANQKLGLLQQKVCKAYLGLSVEGQEKDSIVATLQKLFTLDSNLMYQYACESYKYFVSNGVCTPDMWSKNYFAFATYGVALSNMYFGFDITTGKMQLYTSSFSIISELAGKGLLISNKDSLVLEMQKFRTVLAIGKKIETSLKTGMAIQAVRLEPVITGSKIQFKGTVPRSQLDLNKVLIIPLKCMETCMELLNSYLLSNMAVIKQGDKSRVVTRNQAILSEVYGTERAVELNKFVYNPYTGSMYVPSVGASRYTLGVTKLNLADIDCIKPTSLAQVDLSNIDLNLSLARSYYVSTVKKLKVAELKKLAETLGLDYSDCTTPILRSRCASVKYIDRQYYDLMNSLPDLFNMDDFRNQRNKFGNLYENTPVPNTDDGLRQLLKTGIFKIVITSKTRGMSSMIVTDNPAEIRRIYGVNYIGKYESEGVRLRGVRALLSKYPKDTVSDADMAKITKMYGLKFDGLTSKADILAFIESKLSAVSDRTTNIGTGIPSFRSCNATLEEDGHSKDFYKQVNLQSIVSLIRLSRVEPKKVTSK